MLLKVQIMPKNTYYYCDIYELPVLDKKYHVIQYEILVQKENRRFIHHLLAYECDDGFDGTPYIGGKECGSAGLPTAVSSKCMTKMFVAWGIGGQYVNTQKRQFYFSINSNVKFYLNRIIVSQSKPVIQFIQKRKNLFLLKYIMIILLLKVDVLIAVVYVFMLHQHFENTI